MSRTAAVSSRQELYPRGMPAERALRLGIGALSGLGIGEAEKGFTIEQIRERVRSRYPEAEPLPDRPELDALLAKVGLEVRWDTEITNQLGETVASYDVLTMVSVYAMPDSGKA